MLKSVFLFFKNNGIFGYGLRILPNLVKIRGGDERSETLEKIAQALEDQRLNKKLQDILEDPGLDKEQKRILMSQITKNVLEQSLKNQEDWKTSGYRNSLKLALKHPVYSQVKRKSPYLLMSLPMFQELKRGALARAIGQTTIPLSLTTYLGIAMPFYAVSSILEMVVPYKNVKLTCFYSKKLIGLPFIICCVSIDKISRPFEQHFIGQPLPIDINNLMGTIPTKSDIEVLDKIMNLKQEVRSYPGNLDMINDVTRKQYEKLFPNDDIFSSILPDFDQPIDSSIINSFKTDNISPIEVPEYNYNPGPKPEP
jgi:hypothetical protein